jgi:hypothetical protein
MLLWDAHPTNAVMDMIIESGISYSRHPQPLFVHVAHRRSWWLSVLISVSLSSVVRVIIINHIYVIFVCYPVDHEIDFVY